MTIGEKIRKMRELKCYKQEYLADRLGMSVTAYGNIERGESRLSFERLEQIAGVLNVRVQDILTIAESLAVLSGPGLSPSCRPLTPAGLVDGYGAALGAYEQLVGSLQKDIEYLRRQNEQLMELVRGKGEKLPADNC